MRMFTRFVGLKLMSLHRRYLSNSFHADRVSKRRRVMITNYDLTIPNNEIRQFVKLIHPDRFEKYNFNSDISSQKKLLSIKETNARSLSDLHSIIEFSKKYSKIYSNMIDNKKQSSTMTDSFLPESVPTPTTLEFYVSKDDTTENLLDNMTCISVKFDCKHDRPTISQYFDSFRRTMTKLFDAANVNVKDFDSNNANGSQSKKKVLKFSDMEIQEAMENSGKNGNEFLTEQDEIDAVFSEYLMDLNDGHSNNMKKLNGISYMTFKFEKNKVKFHENLTEKQKKVAIHKLFELSKENSNDLFFDLWLNVPIVIVQNEAQCLQCPSHVVPMPWYFDTSTFLLFIHENIMTVKDNYEKILRKRKSHRRN